MLCINSDKVTPSIRKMKLLLQYLEEPILMKPESKRTMTDGIKVFRDAIK